MKDAVIILEVLWGYHKRYISTFLKKYNMKGNKARVHPLGVRQA